MQLLLKQEGLKNKRGGGSGGVSGGYYPPQKHLKTQSSSTMESRWELNLGDT